MTVAEFISFLQKQPQDIQVAYCVYSEQALLEEGQIRIVKKGKARPDGWIHDDRPGMETVTYLLLPGN